MEDKLIKEIRNPGNSIIGYTIVAKIHENKCVVDYDVFCTGFFEDGKAYYKDVDSPPAEVMNLDEADPFMQVSVKWDHCSNWIMPEHVNNCMTHACSRSDLEDISKILIFCFDWTKELISEAWDK